ncbi:MAG: SpoIIE family protein phosphatase, partial [Treponema sp.]|nr:SpoIIE family protein phosphatase [Treponema sp.]
MAADIVPGQWQADLAADGVVADADNTMKIRTFFLLLIVFFIKTELSAYTLINHVDVRPVDEGHMLLRILGRGFTEEGNIIRVILDRNGLEPFDHEFYLNKNDFQVLNDREIQGIILRDIPEGLYRILLDHPNRSIYVSEPIVIVDKTGTIKFGDYTHTWQPSWTLRQENRFLMNPINLVLLTIIIFCILGFMIFVNGIKNAAAESAAIRMETIALITGDIMPSEKKKRMALIKRRGGGLRLKMASFTIALVMIMVVMISSPLYIMMVRSQEATLLQGLYDRTKVLLEGIAVQARAFMPGNNYLELGYLPSQSEVIPEAWYVTITGYGSEHTGYSDYVLATNDKNIQSKINTAELDIGISRMEDPLSSRIPEIMEEMNSRARAELGEISVTIAGFNREADQLLENPNPTAEERRRIEEIAITTQSLQSRVSEVLSRISQEIGSEPAFSVKSLKDNTADSYIFFKPILYSQNSDDFYYRGLVRLELSIESIISQIRSAQAALLRIIVIIALAAIAIGTLGALIQSNLIIRPIIRLVSHVERIRDTEDKSKLQGIEIEIKSRDEIAVLGNTINDMTVGLVKAAIAASDLSMGKEIQKKFIPLEINREGNKLTSGLKDTKNVQFFGYYEGAKGVSGDYFDYLELVGGRYYAIIKCDVAGKGIPAALIMIQVATMFLGFFRHWKPAEESMGIEELVYQINDFIEALGFKGRFAAFTLCLFDSRTGIARFCNAGDNIIHWYDASEKMI